MLSKKHILYSIIFASFANQVQSSEPLGYEPGELIVRFARKANGQQRTMAEQNAILAAIDGGTINRSSKFVPGLTLVKLPANRTVENALLRFIKVFPNFILFGLEFCL